MKTRFFPLPQPEVSQLYFPKKDFIQKHPDKKVFLNIVIIQLTIFGFNKNFKNQIKNGENKKIKYTV